MYCAMVGDIIDSRKIENRDIFQEKYKSVFKSINDKFNGDIVSYFKIRDGDGFHGLLKSPENLIDIIMQIKLAIAPYQIRIGIGLGEITTKIDKFNVQDSDGSAYSTASDAVDYISKNKNKYEAVYQTTILKFDRELCKNSGTLKVCGTYENLINTAFCACSFIDKNWNSIHADTIQKKIKNKTQRQIADELKISQSAVQQRINSSNYYTYEYYIQNIKPAINELWERLSDG